MAQEHEISCVNAPANDLQIDLFTSILLNEAHCVEGMVF